MFISLAKIRNNVDKSYLLNNNFTIFDTLVTVM